MRKHKNRAVSQWPLAIGIIYKDGEGHTIKEESDQRMSDICCSYLGGHNNLSIDGIKKYNYMKWLSSGN